MLIVYAACFVAACCVLCGASCVLFWDVVCCLSAGGAVTLVACLLVVECCLVCDHRCMLCEVCCFLWFVVVLLSWVA